MNYELVWEPRGVVLYFSRHISISDIQKATAEYEGDIRFDNLLYVIADYTQIIACNARPAEIENVWVMDYGAKHSNQKVKKAIVTTSYDVIKLATHYKHELGPAFPVEIFATQIDARVWLSA